jgi:hypothetical protein
MAVSGLLYDADSHLCVIVVVVVAASVLLLLLLMAPFVDDVLSMMVVHAPLLACDALCVVEDGQSYMFSL